MTGTPMRLLLAFCFMLASLPAAAQQGPMQAMLQTHAEDLAKPSRRTIQPVIDDLAASGLPQMTSFLEAWSDKGIVQHDADGLFFYGEREGDLYVLRSVEDGSDAGEVGRREATELKPNAG